MDTHKKLVDIIVSTDLGKSSGRLMDAYNIADNLLVNGVILTRHGQWEVYQIPPMMCCSECDWGTAIQSDFKYCPNCGACMDGKSAVPR